MISDTLSCKGRWHTKSWLCLGPWGGRADSRPSAVECMQGPSALNKVYSQQQEANQCACLSSDTKISPCLPPFSRADIASMFLSQLAVIPHISKDLCFRWLCLFLTRCHPHCSFAGPVLCHLCFPLHHCPEIFSITPLLQRSRSQI